MYSLSSVNTTFQELVYQVNMQEYEGSQLDVLSSQLYGFALVFYSCLFTHLGISLYVIKNADHLVDRAWRPLLAAAKVLVAAGLGFGAGLALAEAPVVPTTFSQAVHTKTSFGRGYDCELGDAYGKFAATKCQQLAGRDKFIEVAKKYSKDMIVSQSVLEKIIQDPQIEGILREKASIVDRQLLGLLLEQSPQNTRN